MKKRILSFVLVLCLVVGCLPLSASAASNPYPRYQDTDGDGYNEVRCTWFAWQQVYDNLGIALPGWTGNAKTWGDNAAAAGYLVDTTPAVNTVMVSTEGYYGHVAFVTGVSGNTFTVNEAGRTDLDHTSSQGVAYGRRYTKNGYMKFIHFGPVTPPAANIGDQFYAVILNTSCWKPISQVEGTQKIYLKNETGSSRQIWKFTRQSDNAYVISSCYDGKALEMDDGIRKSGTQLCAHGDFWGGAYQQWYLIPYGDGYLFKNKHYPDDNWVMDLSGGDSSDGNIIQIFQRNNTDAQIWSIYRGDEVQLKGPTLKVTAGNSDTITSFSWNKVYGASTYNLRIFKDQLWKGQDYSIEDNTNLSQTKVLPEGKYFAYVDACNYHKYEKGNVVEFTVKASASPTPALPALPNDTPTPAPADSPDTDTPNTPDTPLDPTPENSFVDVPNGAYFAKAVNWAVEKGITSGTSKTTFSPNQPCTRAQAVTFLWRAAGSPEPRGSNTKFTDVPGGTYYTKAVQWAVENGITGGTSASTFSPNDTCTRAQIVTFQYRMHNSPGTNGVSPFTDVPASLYYANAVAWAVEHGITSGTSVTTFSPHNDCSRGQIVTFLYRDLA